MRHTFVGSLKNLVLPPGLTLHLPDGRQIEPSEVAAYAKAGQIIKIHQYGKPAGVIRPPTIEETDDYLGANARN